MADPLTLLRQYFIQKKDIVEKDDRIIFSDLSWPKTTKTNYVVYGTGKDGSLKEYYTLECLLFFLKNVQLSHSAYVRAASAINIPVVHRPDRRDLLTFLSSESALSSSIDKGAPLERPVQLKRAADAEPVENVEAAKKPRLENTDVERMRQQMAARLDAPKEQSVTLENITGSLSELMSREKIAALKAKRLAMKKQTIKGGAEDMDSFSGAGDMLPSEPDHLMQSVLDMDVDVTRDIASRERQWRTRTTILQAAGKNFSKSILATLQSIKLKEDGKAVAGHHAHGHGHHRPSHSHQGHHHRPAPVAAPRRPAQSANDQSYDRYAQEKFTKDKKATAGFKIDTLASFAGKTLHSVAEVQPQQKPAAPTPAVPVPRSPAQPQTPKRVSRTPIIVIPAADNKSLITMFNAREVLQDLKFVPTEEKRASGMKRENECLIQRTKDGGLTVPYRVIDNTQRLTNADWDRVVAVFVMGPAWQFKGWPWEGNPVEIFSRIRAFHLKYEEMKIDANVAKWAVHVINLSRNRRHLDRAQLMAFWDQLDQHMAKCKPHLRF